MKELEKGALGGEQERGERRADAILPRLLGQHVYRLKPLMSVGMPIHSTTLCTYGRCLEV